MTLLEFIRLIIRYWKVLVFLPLTTALVVFFLTRKEHKEYTSSCEVYTGIASGYGITSGENDRVDYFAVNNAFDNLMATIKSRETVEEVGLRLLARHLLVTKPAYNELSQENFDHLKEIIPDKLRQQLVVKGSPELTYFRLDSYKRGSDKNEIVKILNSGSEIYGSEKIMSNMSALRKQSSDMIDITYKCNDPAACQQTLQYIVDVVILRYKGIKGNETNNVVKYFEEQLELAAKRLRKSEDHLRDFSSENKIINYYEQAKFIAESKENVVADKQKQEMDLEASKSALSQIEKKMNLKKGLLDVNEHIQKLREQLADANYKMANAELYNEDPSTIEKFKAGAETLKRQIREEVEKQYKLNNTTEGLPRMNLLQDWLQNYLAVSENQSKLDVINKRLSGFDAMYTELAPIGSNLKRIEREVDVNEKEYLSVLHGLNMARLRQQSLEMSNNLTLTDAPFLPLEALPSKRMLLVAVAFIAVFILSLAVIIGKSLLGKTVQTAGRAEKFTGLQFLSAFPNYDSLGKLVIREHLDTALMAHVSSTIRQQLRNCPTPTGGPILITVCSTRKQEGKSSIGERVAQSLSDKKGKSLWMNPDLTQQITTDETDSIAYPADDIFQKSSSLYTWLEKQSIKPTNYKYIVLELEELNKYNLPEEMLSQSCLNLLVLDSERVWSEADSRALSHFTKTAAGKTTILLNKVELDRLEAIIGEIPKRRSLPRRIIKRIVTFDFKRT